MPYDLFFGVQYNQGMYVHNKLLSLLQALETYHRREIGGQYLSVDEFERYYQDLCKDIPDEYDGGFTSHLKNGTFKHANEYSLQKRLEEIVEQNKEVLKELPLEIESNLRLITNSRNYFTHYDEDISPRAEQSELWPLILQLRAIVETVLLTEIGLSEEHLTERLSRIYNELARNIE